MFRLVAAILVLLSSTSAESSLSYWGTVLFPHSQDSVSLGMFELQTDNIAHVLYDFFPQSSFTDSLPYPQAGCYDPSTDQVYFLMGSNGPAIDYYIATLNVQTRVLTRSSSNLTLSDSYINVPVMSCRLDGNNQFRDLVLSFSHSDYSLGIYRLSAQGMVVGSMQIATFKSPYPATYIASTSEFLFTSISTTSKVVGLFVNVDTFRPMPFVPSGYPRNLAENGDFLYGYDVTASPENANWTISFAKWHRDGSKTDITSKTSTSIVPVDWSATVAAVKGGVYQVLVQPVSNIPFNGPIYLASVNIATGATELSATIKTDATYDSMFGGPFSLSHFD